MKRAIKIAARASIVLTVVIVICMMIGVIGPVTHTRLRQFDDLTANEMAALEHQATHEGDQAAAAKLYWYYRLNRQDYVSARKWEYAVLRPGETNSGLPGDSIPGH